MATQSVPTPLITGRSRSRTAATPQREHLPGLESTMCRKVRQKVNGQWRYIRSCAFLGEPGVGNDERYCIHRSGTYNIHVEYCTCRKKDGCNGAGNTRLSWSVGAVMTLITLTLSSGLRL